MMKQTETEAEASELGTALIRTDVGCLENQCSTSRGASVSSAVFNICTTMVGAGIMSIPATVKVLGIIPSFLVIFIIALLVEVTVEFLLTYTQSGKANTYAGVMAESFGSFGSIALQLCVVITNLGCLIIYLIIIDSLRHSSAISILLAVVFIAICSSMAIYALCKGKTQKLRWLPDIGNQVSIFDLFTTVPVLVTGFGFHANSN